jgi:hypothetical protein
MKMKMEDKTFQENLNLLLNGAGYTEIIWLLVGGDITKTKEIYKLNFATNSLLGSIIDKRKVELQDLKKNNY